MKILVCFKRVPDPASAASSGLSGADQWIINPFDEIAIEEALRIRERGEANEIVGLTIGTSAAEEQIRSALAMGLDRVLRVEDDRPLDPYSVSRILRAVVQREDPALVFMGKQAVDDDANQVGQMLAGLLGWPQATFVSRIELVNGGAQVQCERETDQGIEVLALTLPAVITADLRLNEPRYVSLPGLMKARRRPIELLTRAELGVDVQPRTTVTATRSAPQRSAGIRVESVEELVLRLRKEEKLV